jgi:hypothetical protein
MDRKRKNSLGLQSLERAASSTSRGSGLAGGDGASSSAVAVGTRVVIIKTEKSQDRVGQEAEVTLVPSAPNTWYKVRFADGGETRVRLSGFRVLGGGGEVDARGRARSRSATSCAEDSGGSGGEGEGEASSGVKRSQPPQHAAPRQRSSSLGAGGERAALEKAVLVVGARVEIRETANVRQRVSHLVGQRGTIAEVPSHPNTWFKVGMDSGGSGETIKFQATALVPLDADGKPLELWDVDESLDGDNSAEPSKGAGEQGAGAGAGGAPAAAAEDSAAAAAPAAAKEGSGKGGAAGRARARPGVAAAGGRGKSSGGGSPELSDVTLAEAEPSLWVGATVVLKQSLSETATVLKMGNGWVQLRIDESGNEMARRAHDLLLPLNSPLLDEDGRPVAVVADKRAPAERAAELAVGAGAGAAAAGDSEEAEGGAEADGASVATGASGSNARKRARRADNDEEGGDDAEAPGAGDEGGMDGVEDRKRRRTEGEGEGDEQAGEGEVGGSEDEEEGDESASTAAASPMKRGPGKDGKRSKKKGGAAEARNNNPHHLNGRDIVVSYGLHKGVVGNIENGNGYFYIKTVEDKRVRKKRDQFQVLEPIAELLTKAALQTGAPKPTKQDLDRWVKVKVKVNDAQLEASLVSYTSSYFAVDVPGEPAMLARSHAEVAFGPKIPDAVAKKAVQLASRSAPPAEVGAVAAAAARREAASAERDAGSPLPGAEAAYARPGGAAARPAGAGAPEELGKTRGVGKRIAAAALLNGGGMRDSGDNSDGDVRYRSMRLSARRGAVGTRGQPMLVGGVLPPGHFAGGPGVTLRGATRQFKQQAAIPMTEDPTVNRLLQTNKERQGIVLQWLYHDREKTSKYNQHRPDLRLWLDRIEGGGDDDAGDDAEDRYVPLLDKAVACPVCRLELQSRESRCWNPACWRSPVYEPGAAPLGSEREGEGDAAGATAASAAKALPRKGDPSSYVFAVAQSPRKPGFIEVHEKEFPYFFSVDNRGWESAIAEVGASTHGKTTPKDKERPASPDKPERPKDGSGGGSSSSSNSVPPAKATLGHLKPEQSAADLAIMSGWGRFVSGRKREEDTMVFSPLETFQLRAPVLTLGRRTRPQYEARDSGTSGYFGKGWNDELNLPFALRSRKRPARKRRRLTALDNCKPKTEGEPAAAADPTNPNPVADDDDAAPTKVDTPGTDCHAVPAGNGAAGGDSSNKASGKQQQQQQQHHEKQQLPHEQRRGESDLESVEEDSSSDSDGEGDDLDGSGLLSSLDYRWRSWAPAVLTPATPAASLPLPRVADAAAPADAEAPHPTAVAAAALMSFGTQDIDPPSFAQLQDTVGAVLKPVEAKLAAEAAAKEAELQKKLLAEQQQQFLAEQKAIAENEAAQAAALRERDLQLQREREQREQRERVQAAAAAAAQVAVQVKDAFGGDRVAPGSRPAALGFGQMPSLDRPRLKQDHSAGTNKSGNPSRAGGSSLAGGFANGGVSSGSGTGGIASTGVHAATSAMTGVSAGGAGASIDDSRAKKSKPRKKSPGQSAPALPALPAPLAPLALPSTSSLSGSSLASQVSGAANRFSQLEGLLGSGAGTAASILIGNSAGPLTTSASALLQRIVAAQQQQQPHPPPPPPQLGLPGTLDLASLLQSNPLAVNQLLEQIGRQSAPPAPQPPPPPMPQPTSYQALQNQIEDLVRLQHLTHQQSELQMVAQLHLQQMRQSQQTQQRQQDERDQLNLQQREQLAQLFQRREQNQQHGAPQ